MPARLELYKANGEKVFDSQADRALSYLKTMNITVTLPRPASVSNPTKGWFSASVTDAFIGSNTFALLNITGYTGWTNSWSPVTPALTYYTVSGSTMTVYVYTNGIYQSAGNVGVNIRLKLFRR